MTDPRAAIRRAFILSTQILVRVTPAGFIVADKTFPKIAGRLLQLRLVRKLFEDSKLVCDSSDGVQARDGTLCEKCRHPRCRPQLRIALELDDVHYILDVNATSARNLLTLEDELATEGVKLEDSFLSLSVVSHGHWPEIRFARC